MLAGACEIMCNNILALHTRCDVADALTVMLPGHDIEDEYDDYMENAAGNVPDTTRSAAFKLFSADPARLMKLVRGVLQVYREFDVESNKSTPKIQTLFVIFLCLF